MSESDYRVWSEAKGEMGKVVSIAYAKDGVKMVVLYDSLMLEMLDDVELMQYVGWKDRNGKRIFEGDILNVKIRKNVSVRGTVVRRRWDTGFEVKTAEDVSHPSWVHADTAYEVIGNRFENPDLLGNGG